MNFSHLNTIASFNIQKSNKESIGKEFFCDNCLSSHYRMINLINKLFIVVEYHCTIRSDTWIFMF